jgi:tetratricopeptide (TPR) repeat protein
MSPLVFELSTQITLWGQEIWMANMSPVDCRAAHPDACTTVGQHHQEMIEFCDNRSIEMDPNEPMNYLLRGARYLKSHQIEKALMDVENFARLEQACTIRPDAYLNRRLKYILIRKRFLYYLVNPLVDAQGKTIEEDSPGRNGLAWSFFYQGLWFQREKDYEKAVDLYRTATTINPALAVAFHNLALIQATSPMPQHHDGLSALGNAEKACDLTAWKNVLYIETYAAAQARVGDFAAAVKWQQEAVRRFGSETVGGMRARARAKLDLYQCEETYEQQYLWPNTLVAWWKFDQDDNDTQQVQDHSGHDLHGQFMGDACIVPDPARGEVLSLDGKGDFVDCGQDCRFDLTDKLSICAWIKPRIFNKKHQALISNGDRGWMLNRQAFTNSMQAAAYAVVLPDDPNNLWSGHLPTQTEITDGQWHHLVAVYDGARLRLYVDGVQDATCAVTGQIRPNDWPVFIGENSEQTKREWNGLIDDVRIYSYALTPQEIKAVYSE